MSCRHCCINSKKYLSKTFSFHKIIYKYFASFLACIKSSLRGYCRSNPLYLDCHASLCSARNDDNKNFQFDKFQRLFSVIYKKNLLIKEISK